MKKILGFTLLLALLLTNTAYAKEKTLVGKISAFDCGDNCYLTIVDKKGKEHHALCFDDKICEQLMNATDENLGGYKGKQVKVTVGVGNQVDGADNIMGTMDAFTKIELIK